jgi:probable F420-dependent oxidoreductase
VIRIGARLETSGHGVARASLVGAARAYEAAGFDSVWVSDHVVQPRTIASPYPYSADGVAGWPTDEPFLEAVVAMTLVAAVTERVEIGTAVLVLPQRNPVLLAKQLATLDLVAGGRIALGVGAGWLAEEFAALGADFDGRGRAMTESIEVLRRCWTGSPEAFDGDSYTLPGGLVSLPAPAHPIPVLIGGMSSAALRRAASTGDGWLAQVDGPAVDLAALETAIASLDAACSAAGRDPSELRVVVRVTGPGAKAGEIAPQLRDLAALGVDDVIVSGTSDAAAIAALGELLRSCR